MTLEQAIILAAHAHEGQVDKGDAPYILHPLRVMGCMDTMERKIVAVLHDVLEDRQTLSLHDLKSAGFSADIIEAVDAITRRNGEEYEAYIERCARNAIAHTVKMYDLLDNMNLNRIKNPTDADRERWAKYNRAWEFLRTGRWPS